MKCISVIVSRLRALLFLLPFVFSLLVQTQQKKLFKNYLFALSKNNLVNYILNCKNFIYIYKSNTKLFNYKLLFFSQASEC